MPQDLIGEHCFRWWLCAVRADKLVEGNCLKLGTFATTPNLAWLTTKWVFITYSKRARRIWCNKTYSNIGWLTLCTSLSHPCLYKIAMASLVIFLKSKYIVQCSLTWLWREVVHHPRFQYWPNVAYKRHGKQLSIFERVENPSISNIIPAGDHENSGQAKLSSTQCK